MTNICNLNPYCPLCAAQLKGERKKGTMDYEKFVELIDETEHHLEKINLAGHGEPVVNKDVWKMIQYAEKIRFG